MKSATILASLVFSFTSILASADTFRTYSSGGESFAQVLDQNLTQAGGPANDLLQIMDRSHAAVKRSAYGVTFQSASLRATTHAASGYTQAVVIFRLNSLRDAKVIPENGREKSMTIIGAAAEDLMILMEEAGFNIRTNSAEARNQSQYITCSKAFQPRSRVTCEIRNTPIN